MLTELLERYRHLYLGPNLGQIRAKLGPNLAKTANCGTIGQSETEILYALNSANLGAYIFQGAWSTWSFFASQGFILSILNPKHQRLPWDSFFVDPGKDDQGSTFCVHCMGCIMI
jgi:hypothetical protein